MYYIWIIIYDNKLLRTIFGLNNLIYFVWGSYSKMKTNWSDEFKKKYRLLFAMVYFFMQNYLLGGNVVDSLKKS